MKFNLKELFDELVPSVAVRLESEYLYYEVFDDGRRPEMISSSCFVKPPSKGEYYLIYKKDNVVDTYEVVNVAHVHNADRAGYLYLKKVTEIKF